MRYRKILVCFLKTSLMQYSELSHVPHTSSGLSGMARWCGRVAVVTGASAGIGAAIAYQLQDAAVDVVGLAPDHERIGEAVEAARRDAKSRGRSQIDKAATPGKLHCLKCDITKEEDVLAVFKWVKENTKGADILVNNAGIFRIVHLYETKTEDWKNLLDTNVLGLSICTREAVLQMRDRGVDDGHIVHISSIYGHYMPAASAAGLGMYHASKHAVRVLTEGLRKELISAKTGIRVSEISPGLVKTAVVDNWTVEKQNELWQNPYLFPEDVADAVLYTISRPSNVQVHEVIIRPIKEEL